MQCFCDLVLRECEPSSVYFIGENVLIIYYCVVEIKALNRILWCKKIVCKNNWNLKMFIVFLFGAGRHIDIKWFRIFLDTVVNSITKTCREETIITLSQR